MSIYLVLAVFGGLAGVTTVLFGFGGGFVVVPLLYRALILAHGADSAVGQASMHIAVATSTCVMIVSASLATRRHQRAGTLDGALVRPLLAFIGIGAVVGAALAVAARGEFVRWAFIAYLGATILDCLFRPGFMTRDAAAVVRPLSRGVTTLGSFVIGLVAAFLGVGGSVMTVPLMRRRGIDMTRATAMANPLSLPIALAGTATYMLLAWRSTETLEGWHIGYVDVPAFAALVAGSLVGVRAAAPLIGRMPERVHTWGYIALLVLVLAGMALR
ncbi:sulfite exporter TauE/SafE family protein [Variovorax sp. J22G73]|uniref:sulfite exporter TauE/SafE family protein n=1 Tax=unclassified Variovorax TaxID=663243 RepID=UPI000D5CF418|nr:MULTISPECIES: sulfite exporter TauE/SafE family protein [unclassified Variovorax]MDM0010370.1 sulfite exporter TauE/SafE family protein [Variovorax sp. J22R203]MDM0102766.1 sulfite exporter TauE/SafE family protein [Variovorax sp. J22G73]